MKKHYNTPLLLLVASLLLSIGGGMGWWLAIHGGRNNTEQANSHVDTPETGQPRKVLYWFDPMAPQQHFDKPGKSPFMDMQLIAKYADEESDHNASHAESLPTGNSRKILYWYDPMAPQQHFDKPGKSPFMDMELIAKYADTQQGINTQQIASEETVSGIRIDPTISENIGIRLATVSRMPLSSQIEATGQITFNERDVAVVQARSGGFVERVWPLAAGDIVKAGQPLVEILTPEWVAAQQELLAVRGFADPALLTAARERLRLLGMPEHLIRQLERTGVAQSRYTVNAPLAGVIQTLEVRNGMTLSSAQTLARINGLSTVWLEVAVPEAQTDSVHVGDRAQVRLTAFPEHGIEGRIAAILPALNETSRTIRVRIELKNPRQQLRPGLSAQVRLSNTSAGSALAVPTEALIRTGKRTLVMLASESGRFSPIEVGIGHEIGDQTQIISGLEEGQHVVASGQFLIDSEASLNGIEAHSVPAGRHAMESAP